MFHCYVSETRVDLILLPYTQFFSQKKDSTLVSQNAKRALHLPNSVVFFRKMLDSYDRNWFGKICWEGSNNANKILLPSFHIKAMFFLFLLPTLNPPPQQKNTHVSFFAQGCQWTTLLWLVTYTSSCWEKYQKTRTPETFWAPCGLNKPWTIRHIRPVNNLYPCELKPGGFSGKRLYTFQVTKLCYYLMAFSTARKLRKSNISWGFWLPGGHSSGFPARISASPVFCTGGFRKRWVKPKSKVVSVWNRRFVLWYWDVHGT